jgi:hypothetical protein
MESATVHFLVAREHSPDLGCHDRQISARSAAAAPAAVLAIPMPALAPWGRAKCFQSGGASRLSGSATAADRVFGWGGAGFGFGVCATATECRRSSTTFLGGTGMGGGGTGMRRTVSRAGSGGARLRCRTNKQELDDPRLGPCRLRTIDDSPDQREQAGGQSNRPITTTITTGERSRQSSIIGDR